MGKITTKLDFKLNYCMTRQEVIMYFLQLYTILPSVVKELSDVSALDLKYDTIYRHEICVTHWLNIRKEIGKSELQLPMGNISDFATFLTVVTSTEISNHKHNTYKST